MKLTRIRLVLVAAAAIAIFAGMLSNRLVARAQESEAQHYIVQAGAGGPWNMDVLAFAPQTLQVHRGDTVTWLNNGFHDIHFEDAPVPLVIEGEANGQTIPMLNPAIAFRTLDSGATYSGGDANSGLPLAPGDAVWSLVIDLEPGTYTFMCDIHPGMVGILSVVEDDVTIPNPSEAAIQGAVEFGGSIGAANAVGLQLEAQPAQDGMVQVGSGDTGRVTLNMFFPLAIEITAGESVTFTNPETSVDPHTVSRPPVRGQDVIPVPVEGGPPILQIGPTLLPIGQSGDTVGLDDEFSSGLILPGQSYTLTFEEPGVYSYVCNLHAGMAGVIVVQPSS
jgi:plastocyanin